MRVESNGRAFVYIKDDGEVQCRAPSGSQKDGTDINCGI